MNPLKYWEDHFCYRGENYDGILIYDYNINKIDGDIYLSGQKVFPGTLKESLPNIYFEDDKTYIFPGDEFTKTVLDSENELIYSLLNVHAELDSDGEFVLIDKDGKRRELLSAYMDGDNHVKFEKSE